MVRRRGPIDAQDLQRGAQGAWLVSEKLISHDGLTASTQSAELCRVSAFETVAALFTSY